MSLSLAVGEICANCFARLSIIVSRTIYNFRQFPYTFPNGPDACPDTLNYRLQAGLARDGSEMKSQIIVASLFLLAADIAAATDPQQNDPADEASVAASRGATTPGTERVDPLESRWRLGVALGYGSRTNPLVQSDDIPIIVDLDISWFGDHFFFDNGDLGFTFLDNEYVTTSLVARVNSDRVFFGRTNTKFVTVDFAAAQAPLSDARVTIPDRDYAAELGLELLADGRWGMLQIAAFHDVSGTHEGYEVEFDYGYGWRNQRFYVEPSFGLSFKSEDLNNYYWGVPADNIGTVLPGYTAGSGVNAFARLQFSYQITRNWSFSFVGEVERMNDEAADSPIVEEQNVFGYFAGLAYRFR
jgi:outer membrane protein